MRIKEFLEQKAVTLCFLGIGIVILLFVLCCAGVRDGLLAMFVLLFSALVIGWLMAEYIMQKTKIERLQKLEESIPEKHLLGEVLPVPRGAVERQYFHMMGVVSRSALGLAEQAVRDKNDYLEYVESWIHEIKTPLTACSLILSNDGDRRKLRQELKKVDNLTETILYYARMRTGEKDVRIREFSVNQVMNEAVGSLAELLMAAHVSVEVDGDFWLRSDDKALVFMIKQLLINSAKYSPGCHIRLLAQEPAIIVEDDGIGVPSWDIPRLTDRGFTGENGRRQQGSTGMGLYIVRELCRQFGFSLEIESAAGEYMRVRMEKRTEFVS